MLFDEKFKFHTLYLSLNKGICGPNSCIANRYFIYLLWIKAEKLCFLFQLLQKEPSKRLGSGPRGSEEIKQQKWFKSINWKKLEAREIQPSFRPDVAGKHCIANFDKQWTGMPLLDSPAASPKSNINPFVDFTYVRPADPFLHSSSPHSSFVSSSDWGIWGITTVGNWL